MTTTFTIGHSMDDIFYDKNLNKDFTSIGYVVFDLLNEEDLKELTLIYAKFIGKKHIAQFTTTNVSISPELKIEIARCIDEIVYPKISGIMRNINFWPGAFLIKPIGENTAFEAHQDWTFVDEEQYVSGNLWIPLSDTDDKNGGMAFLESTHYPNIKSIRSQTIPDFFHRNRALLKPFIKPVFLKAGQAVVFNHSIIHYSYPNISNQNRIAISKGFNSSEANLLHYLRTTEHDVELYEMPQNFVFHYSNLNELKQKPINGRLIKKYESMQTMYSDAEIIKIVSECKNSPVNLLA